MMMMMMMMMTTTKMIMMTLSVFHTFHISHIKNNIDSNNIGHKIHNSIPKKSYMKPAEFEF